MVETHKFISAFSLGLMVYRAKCTDKNQLIRRGKKCEFICFLVLVFLLISLFHINVGVSSWTFLCVCVAMFFSVLCFSIHYSIIIELTANTRTLTTCQYSNQYWISLMTIMLIIIMIMFKQQRKLVHPILFILIVALFQNNYSPSMLLSTVSAAITTNKDRPYSKWCIFVF